METLSERIAEVRARLADLQSGRAGRYLLVKHDPTGLGGQISRRLLAIRLALLTGRTAAFADENFYPYETAFETLGSVPEVASQVPTLDLQNLDRDSRPIVSLDFWSFWQSQTTKTLVYEYAPPEFFGIANGSLLLDGVAFTGFRLKQTYRDAIGTSLAKVDALRPVVGIHFRRGDKYVETPYVDSSRYRSALDAASKRCGAASVFVSSDSPNALKELMLDSKRFSILFDDKEVRYNNANHKFLMRHREFAQQETLTAIRNIYALAKCTMVVGQTNAHFARLAAACIMVTTPGLDFGELIEPASAPMRWHNRQLYRAYRTARGVAKAVANRLAPPTGR